MKRESPIEEIWRVRDQLGAEEGYDVHRLFERLRREQQQFTDRLVQPPPLSAAPQSAMALREEARAPGGKSDGTKPRSP
jgi:hypothetical protein